MAAEGTAAAGAAPIPAEVAVLPAGARLAAGMLRAFARGILLRMGAVLALDDGAALANPFAQVRTFAAFFLAPRPRPG